MPQAKHKTKIYFSYILAAIKCPESLPNDLKVKNPPRRKFLVEKDGM
jgi:hypothetical protein